MVTLRKRSKRSPLKSLLRRTKELGCKTISVVVKVTIVKGATRKTMTVIATRKFHRRGEQSSSAVTRMTLTVMTLIRRKHASKWTNWLIPTTMTRTWTWMETTTVLQERPIFETIESAYHTFN